MPDPKRLASFLQRTQRAMQDAVDRGDQAGVDQYENFLDRGNALGERMLGRNNQQSVSNLPQAPQEPPQLGAAGPSGPEGDSGTPGGAPTSPHEFQRGSLVAPEDAANVNGSKIANDIAQESAPSKYSSPLQQMINGVPRANKAQINAPLGPQDFSVSGPPQPYNPAPLPPVEDNPFTLSNILDKAASYGELIAMPAVSATRTFLNSKAGQAFRPVNAAKDLASGVSDAVARAKAMFSDNPLMATAAMGSGASPTRRTPAPVTGTSVSDPEYTPGPMIDTSKPSNIHDEETRPEAAPKSYLTVNPNFRNPDDQEPKFFTLHRLAQILLTGAPSAVRSYDREKEGFEQRQYAKENRAYQSQQHKQDQGWHMQVQAMKDKIESQKAYAALIPPMVREQARAYLNEADLKNKQIDALNRQIPPPDANDPRLIKLQGEVNSALDEARKIATQGFNPVTGNR